MSTAARVKAHRERKRRGGAVLPVPVDDVAALADALVEAHLLPAWDCDDRQAIAAALSRAVPLLLRVVDDEGGV